MLSSLTGNNFRELHVEHSYRYLFLLWNIKKCLGLTEIKYTRNGLKMWNIVKPYVIIKFSSPQGELGGESEIGEKGRYEKGEASYL